MRHRTYGGVRGRSRDRSVYSIAFEVTPVCGLIGPRQCGKTTTAKEIGSIGFAVL